MIRFNKLPRFLYFYCESVKKNVRIFENIKPSLSLDNSFIQLGFYSKFQTNVNFIKSSPCRLIFLRHKSKNRSKKIASQDFEEEEEQDDDYDDDDEIKGKGVEVKTYRLQSLRADLILKTVLGYNRKQIEESFYKNKIRVNEKLLLKKSVNVKVGDVIDVIKGFATENPDFLTVARIEILNIKVDTENEGLILKIMRSKNLLIDNYVEGDKWKTEQLVNEH